MVGRELTLYGMRFLFLDWGNETAAPPLVLLHGFTGHARGWEHTAEMLRDDYRVLALDQRGHGETAWADLYGSRPMLDDLAAFVDALELDPIVLVGQSMGGINALLYAATAPERVDRPCSATSGPEIAREGLQTMTLVFVDDVDEAVAKGTRYGGSIIDPPTDQPWGLRQAVVCDPGGYLCEPSRHLRDVPPESWGAKQFGTLSAADHS
jgi:pimeloyl-ACP methyl ester carboxylesterase